MRLYLLGILWMCILPIRAQYTETINSKRPGFSESPFAVGKRVYQLETGLFYQNSENKTYFLNGINGVKIYAQLYMLEF